jgi:hypothetical protein
MGRSPTLPRATAHTQSENAIKSWRIHAHDSNRKIAHVTTIASAHLAVTERPARAPERTC